MGIIIKDQATEEQAQKLAKKLGVSAEEAIKIAVDKTLVADFENVAERQKGTLADAMAIIERYRSLPLLDNRTPDEILGYNDQGVFD